MTTNNAFALNESPLKDDELVKNQKNNLYDRFKYLF